MPVELFISFTLLLRLHACLLAVVELHNSTTDCFRGSLGVSSMSDTMVVPNEIEQNSEGFRLILLPSCREGVLTGRLEVTVTIVELG